jgi:polysaccharide biosynthesis protein PslG
MAISRKPLLLLAALVAVAAGAVLVAKDGRGETSTRDDFFGVNAPLLRNYTTPERAAALDAHARSMAGEGIKWARVVFDQSVEQRQPGAIDWSVPDRIVAALARQGVRTEALFIGTPAWVANPAMPPVCGSRSSPENVAGWSAFVGAAVERYGRGGAFWDEHPEIPALPVETWEIGNEENTGIYWCPVASPEQYARVYAGSRDAALAADPDAEVIVGGLAPAFGHVNLLNDVPVPDFLRRMISARPELARQIPAVAIHPYASSLPRVLETVRRFREAIRSAGLGETPMIVNEVGWHTSGLGPRLAFQAQRAEWLRRLAIAARQTDCNLTAFGVHGWMTVEADLLNPEDWYGLADPRTGAPNESGRAYGVGIAAAGSDPGAPSSGELGRLCG